MKAFYTGLFVLLFSAMAVAQPWTRNLPPEKTADGNLSFFEIQKAFHDYWDPLRVKNGRYTDAQGREQRAAGWKPFLRWEWFWENRIDPQSGEFPSANIRESIQKLHLAAKTSGKSNTGNWTGLGPSSSPGGYAGLGRLNCVGFHPTNSSVIFVGSASGGFWKTSDGGTTWTATGDQNLVPGVSDICVDPAVPDILYIATGDRESTLFTLNGSHKYDGNSIGVLKSIDGGLSWSATGLSFTTSQQRAINRLIQDPLKPDTLYAATSAGLYRTWDAGTTWTQLNTTEYNDLEFRPGDASILLASTKYGDIYRSTDYGASWTLQYSSFFERCELGVSPDNPDVVYALLGKQDSSRVVKSTDGGISYSLLLNGSPNLLGYACDGNDTRSQWWYDMCIAVHPDDVNLVFAGGVNTWKSTDGGTNWTLSNHGSSTCGGTVTTVHLDKHYLAFQPLTGDLFECNDGGLYSSANDGASWTYRGNGLVTSQIYRLGVSQHNSLEIMTGLQDNGSKFYSGGSWSDILGGDGMECFIDYTDANILYGEYQYGDLRRSLNHGAGWTDITTGLSGSAYWVTPFVMDPNVPSTLYTGYQDVFKSTDRGTNWTKISNWNSTSLRSLAVAPSNSQVIYTATRISLFRTTDGGSSWSNITGTIPTNTGYITYISVKDDDPNTLWVSLGNYTANKVFQSTDGGVSWTDISAGLPAVPVMCVIQDRQVTTRVDLYCAGDAGVYYKEGASAWSYFGNGLPNVIMTELEIRYAPDRADSRLYAASYGRGLWVSELSTTAINGRAGYWTGSTSTRWESPANWEDHTLPGTTTDIVIPAKHRMPVRSGNLVLGTDCGNLILEEGASLEISGDFTLNPGKCLTNGTGALLQVGGNALFRSDATGTASVIDKGTLSISGTTTFERYIPGGTVAYVSCPVSGATRMVFAGSVNNRLYQYDAGSGAWALLSIDATPLELMRGYVVKYASNTTLSFTGTLNQGSHAAGAANHISLSNGGAFGWNLAGNCYPSALDIGSENAPVAGWTFGSGIRPFVSYRKSDGNVAYWLKTGDGTGNNGGTRYIPATQAFWINLEDALNIGFGTTAETQVHQAQPPYKSPNGNSIFRITAWKGTHSDECTIGFHASATDGYDAWDADKLFINDTGFAMVYCPLTGGQNLAINGQSLLSDDRSIQLGFEALQAGNYRFSVSLQEFEPHIAVVLEDIQEGIQQDLRQNPDYSFYSMVVNTVSRFRLHFMTPKIEGKLLYDRPGDTLGLGNCVVQLLDSNGLEIARDTTDVNGRFAFRNVPENCRLTAQSDLPGAGWNSADALEVLNHFTGVHPLSGLALRAADANGNGYINTVDALCIQKRFVGLIQAFIPGEWVFEEISIPAGNPGSTLQVELKGLHVGDVNRSRE